MYSFEKSNPFPLVDFGAASYRAAQEHAACVDRWLGLRIENTEASIASINRDEINREGLRQQPWLNLPAAALLTPYIETRWMLNLIDLRHGDTLIDCGAGYGRMAFVLDHHHPSVNFIGYEYIAERVRETNRVFIAQQLQRAVMIEADISLDSFNLPEAEYYFIYDFGSPGAIRKWKNLRDRRHGDD